ncbi:MAG TPA: RluA family pseudouridine synthase [Dehalococcoidia bacterium]|nr:RluA family pseudouridine synthase [Dehalococcoidia bacterium]
MARRRSDLSRMAVQRLIREGNVLVNGHAAKASLRLEAGDRVALYVPPPRPVLLEAEALPLVVRYEDDDLLVIDKPAGIAVHPAPGHERGTLVNALLHLVPDLAGVGGELRPGIVHRLDKDTSGLIIVAKHDAAHRSLAAQMKAREVAKTYLAIVEGHPVPPEARIDAPIGRHARDRKRMAIVAGGREARTTYRVLESFTEAALLEIGLETGRTHQIRVHLASVGHPVLGDRLYGRPSPLIGRQALHASRLRFRSPSTGREIDVRCDMPVDMRDALAALRGVSLATR